ncbi:MAG: flagellar motor protein MotB [Fibrobacterales bacterium]
MAEECPKCEECVKGAPAYMMTFGDMMSLLLTFFVMLLSMATFEPTKYAMTMQTIQGSFGVLDSYPTVAVMPVVQIPKHSGDESKRKQALEDAKKVEDVIETKNMDDAVKVKMTETGIAIKLKDPVAFSSGNADLKAKGQEILADIGQILKNKPDLKIRVEGHTDDVPIHTVKYDSNWELSTARSLSVLKLLAQYSGVKTEEISQNMSAVGYGEFRPLVPNTNSKNRAENRRIEIFVDYIEK